jgi:CheY-like chemotaxis protein
MSTFSEDAGTKTLIVVVDDDEDDRDFISAALLEQGKPIEIRTFKGGSEFLSYISNTKQLPRLIITDIRMPLVNGFEVIDTVKRDPRTRQLPIVVLSTSGNDEDISKARSLGAAAYFVKPYSFDEYAEITSNIITDLDAGLFGYSANFNGLLEALRSLFSCGSNPGSLAAGL